MTHMHESAELPQQPAEPLTPPVEELLPELHTARHLHAVPNEGHEFVPRPVNMDLIQRRRTHAKDLGEAFMRGGNEFARKYWQEFDKQTWK